MRRWPDVVAAILLAVAAYTAAVRSVEDAIAAGRPPVYYQDHFAPAVLAACGLGYRNLFEADHRELAEFLAQRRARFDCAGLAGPLPSRMLTSFQGISRYLELAVAGVWSVRGVDWTAVLPLFGILFAISTLAIYGLLRLAVPPWAASLVAACFIVSPMQLGNLPNLRDYAKAPFVLLLLLLFGVIQRRAHTARALALLSAACALVAGMGLGFRTDLGLLLPIAVLVVLTAPIATPSRPFVARGAGAALLLGLFAAVAAPVLIAYGRGGNTAHVVLLGFGESFDRPLRVVPAAYSLGSLYNDSYMYARIRAFAEARGSSGQIPIGSTEYDRESARYLSTLVREVPADVLTRGAAAAIGVPRVLLSTDAVDAGYVRGALAGAVRVRQRIVSFAAPAIGMLGVVALVAALAWHPRGTLAALGIAVALAAAAAAQFHPRHFFYLEPLVWWPAVAAAGILRSLAAGRPRRASWLAVAVVFVIMPVSLVVITRIARTWQAGRIESTLAAVASTTGPALAMPASQAADAGTVRFEAPPLRDGLSAADVLARPVSTAAYAITVGGEACDRVTVPVTFRYQSTRPFDDFSETRAIALPLDGGAVTLYRREYERDEPVYGGADGRLQSFLRTRFAGWEIGASDRACLLRVARTDSAAWPATVAEFRHPLDASPYQRLRWEAPLPESPAILAAPHDVSRRAVARALHTPLWREVAFLAPTVSPAGEELYAKGPVESAHSYAIMLQPRSLSAGSLALVSGEVVRGGVTVGIQRGGQWVSSLNVVEAGPFVVALGVPEAGEYQIVVANCVPQGPRDNRFVIRKIGWSTA